MIVMHLLKTERKVGSIIFEEEMCSEENPE